MIVEWFLGLVAFVLGWFAELFGTWTPPPELTEATTRVGTLLGEFSSLGTWIDWTVLGACVLTQIVTWGIVLGVKLIRAVGAHLPWFGGSGD